MLLKITAPVAPPVTVERAKERLHIDSANFDDDLAILIDAAVGAVEGHTGRVLARSSWELRLDCWPGCEPIRLPLAPIRDVTDVVYLDATGAEVAIADDWYWYRTAAGADVRFVSGFSAPTLYERPGSLRVRFDAGYDAPSESGSGDDPELVMDARLEIAVLFLVGTWFERREHVQADQQLEVPETFRFLANQLRIFR